MSLALSQRVDARSQLLARATIEHHSKSFALASKLLPKGARLEAQVLYAFCRRADDAVDEAPVQQQPARLQALREELDQVYDGSTLSAPLLGAFQHVVHERAIPRAYPEQLLAGMEMDVVGCDYETLEQLLLYCYRVAGVVGLMMCHVMGVRNEHALRNATHLGIGMQLTNIARDVLEDWQRGRLYLPDEMLARHGADGLRTRLGQAFPQQAAPAVGRVLQELLSLADGYYASGDAGLRHLAVRCAFGVRTARLVYAEIGHVLRRRGCDPLRGRAVVPTRVKLRLAALAALKTLAISPLTLLLPPARVPTTHLTPSRDVLLLGGD